MKAAIVAIVIESLAVCAVLQTGEPAKPIDRETHRGFIVQPDNFQLFGEGQKEFTLSSDNRGWGWEWPLCFASEAAYRETERHSGVVVEVRGRWVHRGCKDWFLVEGLELVK
jgi:hypothetical protein